MANVLAGIRAVLAVGVAAAASLSVMLLVFQLTEGQPFWLAETIGGACAAAVWMAVCLMIAPRSSVVRAVVFSLGVCAAWVLCRNLVHSTSSYYGLAPILAACVSASTVWCVTTRARRERALSVALPSLAMLVVTGLALGWPTLGVTRDTTDAGGRPFRVHVSVSQPTLYVWSRTALNIEGPVRIEMDPGSGPGEYRLARATGRSLRTGCEALRESSRAIVRAEIANGYIPLAITHLPFRLAACEQGHLFSALP